MRSLLAFAALVLLVAPGCGDDTSTPPANDLAMSIDMTMPGDMMQLNCLQILMCSSNCTTQACVNACIAEGKTASKTKAGALLLCAEGACMVDGGVDTMCVATTAGNGLTGNGPCAMQGTACAQDM